MKFKSFVFFTVLALGVLISSTSRAAYDWTCIFFPQVDTDQDNVCLLDKCPDDPGPLENYGCPPITMCTPWWDFPDASTSYQKSVTSNKVTLSFTAVVDSGSGNIKIDERDISLNYLESVDFSASVGDSTTCSSDCSGSSLEVTCETTFSNGVPTSDFSIVVSQKRVVYAIEHVYSTPAIDIISTSTSDNTDTDGDGVPDSADKCSGTAAGTKVNKDGCPDKDGDGVKDDDDKCADTPAGAAVNDAGCPDSDGDAVFDETDKCADTPAGAKVNEAGCPDSDGDTIFDDTDACPAEAADTTDGCPAKTDPPPIADSTTQTDNSDSSTDAAKDLYADQGCSFSLVHAAGSPLNGIVPTLLLAFSLAPIAIRRRKIR
jgi:hypothetical protein